MIELRKITKKFGDFVANDSIDLKVEKGSIHGLVGENGAGKSTLMKTLFGLHAPTSGEIWVDGKQRAWKSPQAAIQAGIGMVHQHFMLSEPHTVFDNILLGSERSWWRPLDRSRARRKLEDLAERYAPGLNLNSRIEDLPVGVRQKVEILKLLYRDARILILDEPTAVLTPTEIQEFFVRLRELKAEGRSILLITHKLKEVLEVTDAVTVMRAGKIVAHWNSAQATAAQIAESMVGRAVDLDRFSKEVRTVAAGAEAILEVQNFTVAKKLQQIQFAVQAGEILGVAGVDGNGQSELVKALCGALPKGELATGRIALEKKSIDPHRSEDLRLLNVGLVPEDRHEEGLLMNEPMSENVLLGHQRNPVFQRRSWFGLEWLRIAAVHRVTRKVAEDFDVRPRDFNRPLRAFSGGNQQKIILGREMESHPRFLLVSQPTRGVDVGAIELIHGALLKARADGAAILLVSSELDEVLALSDRVLVFYGGRIMGCQLRAQFDRKQIGLWMGGATA